MRAVRVASALLCVALATPAAAVLLPYENADGTSGTTGPLDPTVAARGNNREDVSPAGACGYTVNNGLIVMTGCRDRAGQPCPTDAPCDLDRVPAGRCSAGDEVGCLWPNGAGYCVGDVTVGCLTDAECAIRGLGTCDTSVCLGPGGLGDCSACECQGTNPALPGFETDVCGGPRGVCSDGDSELAFAPSLSSGLCLHVNGAALEPLNCGREAGRAWTGPRSALANPPLTPALQREPGQGSDAGPIVDQRTTQVIDVGPSETTRGGIRRFSILGDSYWEDVSWLPPDSTGLASGLHLWNLWCDTEPGWTPGEVPLGGETCWNRAGDSLGYLWTHGVAGNPALQPPTLDEDDDDEPDCPPHCGLSYDLHTLEQLALGAVSELDARAGAQLAFDALVGGPAARGDLLSLSTVFRHLWVSDADQRCWMGGDPEVVCSTCDAGACSGRPDLACATDRDCALYTGRCSASEQPCDPASPTGATPDHTACPAGQTCQSCVGPYAEGRCVADDTVACRLDADCVAANAGAACGDSAGDPVYPEALRPNPLAIPVGYHTHGFRELELETSCGPTRAGRVGLLSGAVRTLSIPLAIVQTTGIAASEVRDPDLGAQQDVGRLGLVRGRCSLATETRCSVDADCAPASGVCIDRPLVGIGDPAGGPLAGGSFTAGTGLPVDPAGPPCCASTGAVTGNFDKASEVMRAEIAANSGGITWSAGNASEPDLTPNLGTAGLAPLRSSGWGPGTDGTPGCPGDSATLDALGASPDAGPCNDPLGDSAPFSSCGGNCNGNTGFDDERVAGPIGAVPDVPSVAARGKVPNPGASAPTLYAVANLTAVDADLLDPEDTDLAETIESVACPMVGDCSTPGVQDCILDADCGSGATCQNRAKRCENPFGPVADPCAGLGGDADGDTICQAADNCPALSNTLQADADMDGDGDLCDNCVATANPGQENVDGDALGNVCDSCVTIVNAGTDSDMDGIDTACDTCLNVANAFTGSVTNRTLVSGTLDDDGDGRGNLCDFDTDNVGTFNITPTDFNNSRASQGKQMTLNTCGSGANERCWEYDFDGVGTFNVTPTDFNLARGAQGKQLTLFPKCTACARPFSGPPGGAAAILIGRPICVQNGTAVTADVCDYIP